MVRTLVKVLSGLAVTVVARTMDANLAVEEQELRELILDVQAEGGHGQRSRQLYEQWWPALVHYFSNQGMSRQDSEDIAQETMFRVYTHIGGFRFDASFKTWVFRIAGNLLRNRWRDQSTLKRKADEVSLEAAIGKEAGESRSPLEVPDQEASPFENAVAAESADALREAVKTMPPKMRSAFLLHGKGHSNREAATVLGVQVSTVKYQLKEARRRLRTLFPELRE